MSEWLSTVTTWTPSGADGGTDADAQQLPELVHQCRQRLGRDSAEDVPVRPGDVSIDRVPVEELVVDALEVLHRVDVGRVVEDGDSATDRGEQVTLRRGELRGIARDQLEAVAQQVVPAALGAVLANPALGGERAGHRGDA